MDRSGVLPRLVAVAQLHSRTQKKTRPIADAFSALGTTAPWEPLDAETRFGLVIHAERIAKRRAYHQLTAITGAIGSCFGGAGLDKSWFDAMARTPEEAEYQFEKDRFMMESRRMMQQMR